MEGLSAAVRSGGAPAGAAEAAPSDAAALAQAVVAAEVPVKLLGAMQQVGGPLREEQGPRQRWLAQPLRFCPGQACAPHS